MDTVVGETKTHPKVPPQATSTYCCEDTRQKRVVSSIELSLGVLKVKETKFYSYHPEMLCSTLYESIYSLLTDFEQRFKISQQTKLVAICFFCKFVESVPVDMRMYKAYAVVCMQIACKYEESNMTIPSIMDIMLVYPHLFSSVIEFDSLELDVLKGLRWRLDCVTAAHFLHAVCSHPNVTAFIRSHLNDASLHHKANDYLFSFCEFFLDLLYNKYDFRQYVPSVQACACFVNSLHVFQIKPLWSNDIANLFHADYESVKKCSSKLWMDYVREFPDYVQPDDKGDFLI